MLTPEEVKFAFTPVGDKLSAGQKMALQKAENLFRETALEVLQLVPKTADRTSALRKLLEAKFMCSQAITHSMSPEDALVKKEVK